MVNDKGTALRTAGHLLQIKAIKLQPQEPFQWSSGWNSPIYCDNRITLSHPETRNFLKEELAGVIKKKYGLPDAIAGVATGAIGIGALVADLMEVPFVYVRPKPKSHGRKNQIEGALDQSAKVVVVEDLISTGKSSLQAVDALRDEGAQILGMVSLFDYGFAFAKANFKKANVTLYSLSDYEHLLMKAETDKMFTEKELELLARWRQDPENWTK